MSLNPGKEVFNFRRASRLNLFTGLVLLSIFLGSLLLAEIVGRTDSLSLAFLWVGFFFTFPFPIFFALIFFLYSKKYPYRKKSEGE